VSNEVANLWHYLRISSDFLVEYKYR
jgi:hypothetical protein